MSLILGIDPGSRKTGFGIISYVSGRSEYITSGVIRLSGDELPERLRVIFDSVTELVELHCHRNWRSSRCLWQKTLAPR
jgi:crossover junction endodeoxyribonuclease RuvC